VPERATAAWELSFGLPDNLLRINSTRWLVRSSAIATVLLLTYMILSDLRRYLDSEQRLVAAKVIKRFILHSKKTGFIVEHDFIMATYLADRVVVFSGEPSVNTVAESPEALLSGMNKFLQSLDITFRRDPTSETPPHVHEGWGG